MRLQSKKIIAAILILPVILILSLFLLPDSIVGRYKQVFSSEQFTVVEGQETYNSIQSRLVQWDSALEIISEHPWLGVSPGDAQAELRVKYKEKQFGVGLSEGYNAHNGFLQDQLALGVLGGAFWLLFFVMNFRWALREGNVILFVFWVLFATAILTESILERNWGVYWLMLFTWIFAVGRSVDPQDGNKEAHK
jgi:O-antigen ligase